MSQPQPQRPPASVGIFIVGIVAGFFAGGSVLAFLLLLLGALIAQALSPVDRNTDAVAFGSCYVIAIAVGVLAFLLLVRKGVNFLSGFTVGVTGGLLGGITLCSAIIGGFSNMH